MEDEHLDKTAWRQRVVSERRSRLALATSPVPDAVSQPAPDLAFAPGLEGVLPSAGEWAAAYLSLADEPPTAELLQFFAAREIRVLVPAPGPARRDVAWAEVEAATCGLPAAPPGQLPEPAGPRLEASALGRCRLVLAPALAVDLGGTRLGRGGGWYDRALAHAAEGALVLAACFPWEVLPAGSLPREAHDRPVDGALTGAGVALF
ncbi:MAG: 5-formyltetrahydrofolate cyclo-ligase [Bifidobacteriaceae bacterium]|nr:5-formyltetrahydrofolate cyclo-ligase [Bifidobacteriaceae bacterium]